MIRSLSLLFFFSYGILLQAVWIQPKRAAGALIMKTQDRRKVKETIPENIIVATTEKKTKTLSPLQLCFCGALATIFGDFIMHPIDTIKIVQQASGVGSELSFLGAAKKILSGPSGIFGFYNGVLPYLAADGCSGAIKFATFEISKVFMQKRFSPSFSPLIDFAAAAGSLLASSILLVPGEVLKTKLQTGVMKSLVEGVVNIVKTEGFGGLFVGYYATLVRDLPYTILELGLYENIKTLIRKYNLKKSADKTGSGSISQGEELLAAAITGGFTAFVTTPLDLVKTKLMIQSASGGLYSGFFDAFSSIYADGGVKALFVGSFARVTWLLPFTTIYLGMYEYSKRFLLARQTPEMDNDGQDNE